MMTRATRKTISLMLAITLGAAAGCAVAEVAWGYGETVTSDERPPGQSGGIDQAGDAAAGSPSEAEKLLPSANLSDGGRSLQQQNGLIESRLELGEVQVGGANPLVNRGFRSEGARLDVGLPGDVVQLSVGGEFVRPPNPKTSFSFQNLPGSKQSTPEAAKPTSRTGAEMSVAALRSPETSLSLRGSFFDSRPKTGAVAATNRVFGVGGDIGLFAGRATVSTDIGWSQYRNGAATPAGPRSGIAQRHRLDVTAWQSGTLKISAFGSHQRADAQYRAIETSTLADHEIVSYGGTIDYRGLGLDVVHEGRRNNVDADPSRSTTTELTERATLSLNPQSHLTETDLGPIPGVLQAMPQTMAIQISREREFDERRSMLGVESLSASPDEETLSSRLDLSWAWRAITNALTFKRATSHEAENGELEMSSQSDSIKITPGYDAGRWHVSGGLAFSRTTNVASTTQDRAISSEFNFGLTPVDLPDLASENSLTWNETGSTGETHAAYRGAATIDFSKFLPEDMLAHDGFLRTSAEYKRSWAQSDEEEQVAMTWTVSAGLVF